MNILLLQFNNYSNRRIKFYSNVEDYISHASNSQYSLNNRGEVGTVNFAQNDGIRTTLNVNWSEEWNPDYLLVLDEKTGKIISRWFIDDREELSKINFNFSLKRDVIADRYAQIINAPCFVEKGYVKDTNNLVFNKEDFQCNQIKVDEESICDKSYTAWLVVYYNLKEQTNLSGSVEVASEPSVNIGTTLDSWSIYAYHTNPYKIPKDKNIKVKWYGKFGIQPPFLYRRYSFNFNNDVLPTFLNEEGPVLSAGGLTLQYTGSSNSANAVIENIGSHKSSIKYWLNYYRKESTSWNDVMKWNGVLIKTSDNKYYRIRIESEGDTTETNTLTTGDLFNELSGAFKTGGVLKTGWSGDLTNTFDVEVRYTNYKVYADKVEQSVQTYNYNFTSIKSVQDAAYGILAFPFDNKYRTKDVWDGIYKLDIDLGVLIVRDLCAKGVGPEKVIYDVQILPYCPIEIPSTIDASGGSTLDFTDLDSSLYTEIKDSGNNVKSIVIHPLSCKRTEYINFRTWMTNQFYFASGKYAYKVENQCNFYRIVSPNFNGQFEFNRARNRNFNTFRADMTFKPYQPYIHVAPIFDGLYGSDFGDARGLICGGDFSFGVTSDKFEEYKMQNKNFQDIFNRQIENMDVNYNIAQEARFSSTILGATGGAASAMTGGALGHPAAAAGGSIGGVGSIIGGAISMNAAKQQYKENRDYAIDIHNYQLGNVKAMPDSLAKVDAYNNNNKLFPILEKYSCTDEEIAIFNDKIKYEGMTINAIGKIADYIDNLSDETFVKGRMIRLNDLDEDNHYAQEVIKEIALGLYFEKGE